MVDTALLSVICVDIGRSDLLTYPCDENIVHIILSQNWAEFSAYCLETPNFK